MQIPVRSCVAFVFVVLGHCGVARAESLVHIETVRVGDPGNAPFVVSNFGSFGAVAQDFNIGKYEVTIGQYVKFLNAVAATNSESFIVALWNPNMETDLNIAGIKRAGGGTALDPYTYSAIGPFGVTPAGAANTTNRPVTYVSWFDAARFCNWLHNGATNGADTETGAYTLNGATNGIVEKNISAKWWIPTEDEWFKAAYYKGGSARARYWQYPMQTGVRGGRNYGKPFPENTIGGLPNQANYKFNDLYCVTQSPIRIAGQNYLSEVGSFGGSPSAYGTFDQGGNVEEWSDTVRVVSDGGRYRVQRGGSWDSGGKDIYSDMLFTFYYSYNPDSESSSAGFRVAALASPLSIKVLPTRRTLSTGGAAKLAVVVLNHSTQPASVTVDFSSSNESVLGAPASVVVDVAGKKTEKGRSASARRTINVSAPSGASGQVALTATIGDSPLSIGRNSASCLLTVKPPQSRR